MKVVVVVVEDVLRNTDKAKPRMVEDRALTPGSRVLVRGTKRKGKGDSSSSSPPFQHKRKRGRPWGSTKARTPSNIPLRFTGKSLDSAVSRARADRGYPDSASSIDFDPPEEGCTNDDDDVVYVENTRSTFVGQRFWTSGVTHGRVMDERTEAQRLLEVSDPTIRPSKPSKLAVRTERMARDRFGGMDMEDIVNDVTSTRLIRWPLILATCRASTCDTCGTRRHSRSSGTALLPRRCTLCA